MQSANNSYKGRVVNVFLRWWLMCENIFIFPEALMFKLCFIILGNEQADIEILLYKKFSKIIKYL